ncbi:MAG: phosphoesterase, partial [Candidatus Diapherotrites archaeon]|nr:phosphoesterase [Candidatus Diapherotrites archaeon]
MPVMGAPAAMAGKTLFIADLHVGIEREYWRAGVRVSGLSRRVRENVEQILDATNPKRIVVVGDLKHNIPDFTLREAEEVRTIAEIISSQGELIIAKGNHDGD